MSAEVRFGCSFRLEGGDNFDDEEDDDGFFKSTFEGEDDDDGFFAGNFEDDA